MPKGKRHGGGRFAAAVDALVPERGRTPGGAARVGLDLQRAMDGGEARAPVSE
jgi:hypothetical protein